jgi:hypothetical protein
MMEISHKTVRQQPHSLAERMGMLGAVVLDTPGAVKILTSDVCGGLSDTGFAFDSLG